MSEMVVVEHIDTAAYHKATTRVCDMDCDYRGMLGVLGYATNERVGWGFDEE